MTGSITYEQLAYMTALVVGAFVFWFFLEARMTKILSAPSSVAKDAMLTASKAVAEIGEIKLQLAREYTSNRQAMEMEERIMDRISEMATDLHAIRDSFTEYFKSKSRVARRRS